MLLKGNIWKKDKHWLVELPLLDLMTQGESRQDALFMISDSIKALSQKDFKSKVSGPDSEGNFYLLFENPDELLPFVLKRIRESEGLSLRDAAKRLHLSSHNTYARYEKGLVKISFKKFQEYLKKLKGLDMVSSAISLKKI